MDRSIAKSKQMEKTIQVLPGIICVCWVAGTLVGFLPLFGWNAGETNDHRCIFTNVMDYDYLVFLYFATIIFPALLIAAFYAHIYRVIVKQVIDGSRRMDGTYPERRVSSIREKETRQNATDVGNALGNSILISNFASATNKRMSEEESASDSEIVDRKDDATDRGISSSMELQTYKSLAPLLPAEENHVEETPPASIFVIEADVVNHASPDHLLVLEESRDRIDITAG